ncbi:nitrite reductase small subunit NirD [Saliterribacillus persicus]|uniref:Nitrite reductase (NADH) small subunit n=1 Tax=Saliterribacillus persicus TaxID=930114 RepID=A0A368Y0V2_9BACI|nr:nitrite reductase small subunit NirD [Saliterribacillus persicus]RCW71884.1 nitrite reductase (NADH) small subunit [Saliterribacillus persicus]
MENTLRKVFIGKVDEMPLRLGKTIVIDDKEIAVFKLANGDIRAIQNRCPHKGGVLAEGMVSGEHVFCPMHDWKISIVDGQVQAPDEGCVETYKVEVDQNNVYINLAN